MMAWKEFFCKLLVCRSIVPISHQVGWLQLMYILFVSYHCRGDFNFSCLLHCIGFYLSGCYKMRRIDSSLAGPATTFNSTAAMVEDNEEGAAAADDDTDRAQKLYNKMHVLNSLQQKVHVYATAQNPNSHNNIGAHELAHLLCCADSHLNGTFYALLELNRCVHNNSDIVDNKKTTAESFVRPNVKYDEMESALSLLCGAALLADSRSSNNINLLSGAVSNKGKTMEVPDSENGSGNDSSDGRMDIGPSMSGNVDTRMVDHPWAVSNEKFAQGMFKVPYNEHDRSPRLRKGSQSTDSNSSGGDHSGSRDTNSSKHLSSIDSGTLYFLQNQGAKPSTANGGRAVSSEGYDRARSIGNSSNGNMADEGGSCGGRSSRNRDMAIVSGSSNTGTGITDSAAGSSASGPAMSNVASSSTNGSFWGGNSTSPSSSNPEILTNEAAAVTLTSKVLLSLKPHDNYDSSSSDLFLGGNSSDKSSCDDHQELSKQTLREHQQQLPSRDKKSMQMQTEQKLCCDSVNQLPQPQLLKQIRHEPRYSSIPCKSTHSEMHESESKDSSDGSTFHVPVAAMNRRKASAAKVDNDIKVGTQYASGVPTGSKTKEIASSFSYASVFQLPPAIDHLVTKMSTLHMMRTTQLPHSLAKMPRIKQATELLSASLDAVLVSVRQLLRRFGDSKTDINKRPRKSDASEGGGRDFSEDDADDDEEENGYRGGTTRGGGGFSGRGGGGGGGKGGGAHTSVTNSNGNQRSNSKSRSSSPSGKYPRHHSLRSKSLDSLDLRNHSTGVDVKPTLSPRASASSGSGLSRARRNRGKQLQPHMLLQRQYHNQHSDMMRQLGLNAMGTMRIDEGVVENENENGVDCDHYCDYSLNNRVSNDSNGSNDSYEENERSFEEEGEDEEEDDDDDDDDDADQEIEDTSDDENDTVDYVESVTEEAKVHNALVRGRSRSGIRQQHNDAASVLLSLHSISPYADIPTDFNGVTGIPEVIIDSSAKVSDENSTDENSGDVVYPPSDSSGSDLCACSAQFLLSTTAISTTGRDKIGPKEASLSPGVKGDIFDESSVSYKSRDASQSSSGDAETSGSSDMGPRLMRESSTPTMSSGHEGSPSSSLYIGSSGSSSSSSATEASSAALRPQQKLGTSSVLAIAELQRGLSLVRNNEHSAAAAAAAAAGGATVSFSLPSISGATRTDRTASSTQGKKQLAESSGWGSGGVSGQSFSTGPSSLPSLMPSYGISGVSSESSGDDSPSKQNGLQTAGSDTPLTSTTRTGHRCSRSDSLR
jgi:hypothetical protein